MTTTWDLSKQVPPEIGKYLFVLVDNLAKFTRLYPCRSTDTVSVLNRLDKFCAARGIPYRIIIYQ